MGKHEFSSYWAWVNDWQASQPQTNKQTVYYFQFRSNKELCSLIKGSTTATVFLGTDTAFVPEYISTYTQHQVVAVSDLHTPQAGLEKDTSTGVSTWFPNSS